jgi:D-alanyl-D-alanine carboxypeptidase/D-alanyl-D-alanine-endopeptidase (penicillin-binding protein 4)
MCKFLLTCLSLAAILVAQPVAADGLPAPVERAFQRLHIPLDGVGIFVQEIGASTPLLAFDADTPRNPASAMKLLTTLVSLDELGPAYTWKTDVYAGGRVTHGRLQGDLYLKGSGDPYLVTENFWQLLYALRQAGLERIDGDLVLDASYLQPGAGDPGDFDGQRLRAYNVEPNALLVNFQAINFRFLPETGARALRLVADPHPANLVVDNRVQVTGGRCVSWGRGVAMQVVHDGERNTVRFSGKYPRACGEHDMFRVISDAPHYVFGLFKAVWAQLGGQFAGGVREAVIPDDAHLLYSLDSRPLADILRSINKYSNNVMTRQLVLTLGAAKEGAPGTEAKGLGVIRRWLELHGLRFPELVLENGAGLSREEQISPRHLGEVLLTGYNNPYMPEFVSSLPLAGLDGTLRTRFHGTGLEGRLHAKTGSLNNVKSIAGYLLDRQGRRWVVVFLQNHSRADTAAGEKAQDALLSWLYERP